MATLADVPIWVLCLLIFVLRVVDVTLGTLRTVSIVKGHMAPAVVLGFFELMIWVAVISQVIARLQESWWLGLAYAGGFAAGNGVGVMVEKGMARGALIIRLYSATRGDRIANALRSQGRRVMTFGGGDGEGDVTLVHLLAFRKDVKEIVRTAKNVDPDLVYVAEPVHGRGRNIQMGLRPVPNPTGWRAVLKKK